MFNRTEINSQTETRVARCHPDWDADDEGPRFILENSATRGCVPVWQRSQDSENAGSHPVGAPHSAYPGIEYNWMPARSFPGNARAGSHRNTNLDFSTQTNETAASADPFAIPVAFFERTQRTAAEQGRYRPAPGARGCEQ